MAVQLETLYQKVYPQYDVRLKTSSCFEKTISWFHILENIEFAPLLHGEELVFNSTLNDASEVMRKKYIQELINVDAGGLIVSHQKGHELSEELISYCNRMHFPLFSASWETPFINITRLFSEMLLDSERKEMNLIAAFRNAIYHPEDTSLYLDFLEENGFSDQLAYTVGILNYEKIEFENMGDTLKQIKKWMQHSLKQSIIFEEKNSFILLVQNDSIEYLKNQFCNLLRTYPNIQLGIGSTEHRITDIHLSYRNAEIAIKLIDNGISQNPLCYSDLGTYQILADVKEPDIIFPGFVQNTLGKLMEYDEQNRTKYMSVLKDFFKNDCSITQTANATFYHQNTLKYKIKNIKEILGYDIMTNENRVKIMLSLYILNMQKDG